MGMCVCGGAVIACSFGAVPSIFTVLPDNKAASSMPLATVMDQKPWLISCPLACVRPWPTHRWLLRRRRPWVC